MTKEKVSSKRGSGGAKEKGKFGSLAAKWKLFVIIGIHKK